MTLLLARFAVSDSFQNGFSCADFDVVLRGHGDKKELSVSGTSLTIQPSGYNQIWTAFCNVSIDFNVPGAPSLPVSLTAPIVFESSGPRWFHGVEEDCRVLPDPSGTLDAVRFFLNQWVPVDAHSGTVRLNLSLFVPRY